MSDGPHDAPFGVSIEFHGPAATHNYPCPICRASKAVYVLNDDIFTPCWKCRETWTTRRRNWVDDVIDWIKGNQS